MCIFLGTQSPSTCPSSKWFSLSPSAQSPLLGSSFPTSSSSWLAQATVLQDPSEHLTSEHILDKTIWFASDRNPAQSGSGRKEGLSGRVQLALWDIYKRQLSFLCPFLIPKILSMTAHCKTRREAAAACGERAAFRFPNLDSVSGLFWDSRVTHDLIIPLTFS